MLFRILAGVGLVFLGSGCAATWEARPKLVTQEEMDAKFAEIRPAMKQCFFSIAEKNNFQGKYSTRAQFEVFDSGKLAEVKILDKTAEIPGLDDCFLEVLNTLRFSPLEEYHRNPLVWSFSYELTQGKSAPVSAPQFTSSEKVSPEDAAAFEKVIVVQRQQFSSCYEDVVQSAKKGRPSFRMKLKLLISASGKVDSAEALGVPKGWERIGTCITGAVGKSVFPASTREGATLLTYPLIFRGLGEGKGSPSSASPSRQ
jgi:hypothetical protein